ncbi:MAG: T9SS type A sorting domain-containing protein [Flavobacteriales bacterium]|nr:T9SS type A sorting domain-containing protein [Flavobacteriales bacterium]
MRLILAALLFPMCLSAQEDFLSNLTATQLGNLVRIDFTVAAGTSYCLGVDLERSTDGLNFESIGFLPGVCGGSEFEESYFMVDSMPEINRMNHYRLDMGLIGKSDVIEVLFVLLENGIRCFPNPADDVVHIYFDNPNNLGTHLHIVDSIGRTVHRDATALRSFSIAVTDWLPGLYTAIVESESKRLLVNIIVQ